MNLASWGDWLESRTVPQITLLATLPLLAAAVKVVNVVSLDNMSGVRSRSTSVPSCMTPLYRLGLIAWLPLRASFCDLDITSLRLLLTLQVLTPPLLSSF